MELDKQCTFCEDLATNQSATAKDSTNVLDFGKHGDDTLRRMSWGVKVTGTASDATCTSDCTVAWVTSDSATFASGNVTLFSKAFDDAKVVKGAWLIKDEPLPRGLKRYNKLTFTNEASKAGYPDVSAWVYDGRDDGTPYKG